MPPGGVEVMFWDTRAETFARRRNPLLLSPYTSLSVSELVADELHTMHLGVFQDFVLTCFWSVLLKDCFDVGGASENETVQRGFTFLATELQRRHEDHLFHHEIIFDFTNTG